MSHVELSGHNNIIKLMCVCSMRPEINDTLILGSRACQKNRLWQKFNMNIEVAIYIFINIVDIFTIICVNKTSPLDRKRMWSRGLVK